MEHIFAMIEYNVKLNVSTTDNVSVDKITLSSTDGSTIFAGQVWFDDFGNPTFNYNTSSIVLTVGGETQEINDGLASQSWVTLAQRSLTPLTVTVLTTGTNPRTYSSTFTPSSILQAGHKYSLFMTIDYANGTMTASTTNTTPPVTDTDTES